MNDFKISSQKKHKLFLQVHNRGEGRVRNKISLTRWNFYVIKQLIFVEIKSVPSVTQISYGNEIWYQAQSTLINPNKCALRMCMYNVSIITTIRNVLVCEWQFVYRFLFKLTKNITTAYSSQRKCYLFCLKIL